jgi:hypothetical protein
MTGDVTAVSMVKLPANVAPLAVSSPAATGRLGIFTTIGVTVVKRCGEPTLVATTFTA